MINRPHYVAVVQLGARPEQCYFWATHSGAELDLLVVAKRRRMGFEINVIHAGKDTFPLAPNVRAVSLVRLGDIS